MKILKILILIVCLAVFAMGGRLFWLVKKSSSIRGNIGFENGHLKACGNKPNCVSSQADTESEYYIDPIKDSNIESVWDNINVMLPDMGLKLENSQENYLHFTEKSKVFGFTDDVEFLLNTEEGLIEVRSQSRVGYSDMGVNRKRLEKIKQAVSSTLTEDQRL